VNHIPLAAGWVFLVGGLLGVVSVSLAQDFRWSNFEFLESEEELRQHEPMTWRKRLVLLIVCVLISAYGAWQLAR